MVLQGDERGAAGGNEGSWSFDSSALSLTGFDLHTSHGQLVDPRHARYNKVSSTALGELKGKRSFASC